MVTEEPKYLIKLEQNAILVVYCTTYTGKVILLKVILDSYFL